MIKSRVSRGYSRTDQLNGEFQRDIYDIIKNKIHNPLISAMFSITKVDTSKDLAHAKVYVSVYSTDKEKQESTFNAIKEESKKIRYELSKVSRTRTVPELQFILDGSIEYSDKMEKIFNQINNGQGKDEK